MRPTRPPGRTKAQQRAETTRALLDQARRLFAAKGYTHVSVSEIAAVTGVTKGALYHHFASKDGVFRAVLEQVHQEVADRIATAEPDADPWTQLVVGCHTFLAASTEPQIQRIMLVDAPSVLGWGAWREIDAATSRQHLEDILTQLINDGTIPKRPVAPLVHLLSGAMNEAALWLAQSPDRTQDLADASEALTSLLEAVRTSAPSSDEPG